MLSTCFINEKLVKHSQHQPNWTITPLIKGLELEHILILGILKSFVDISQYRTLMRVLLNSKSTKV
jgi:hypothetical protein